MRCWGKWDNGSTNNQSNGGPYKSLSGGGNYYHCGMLYGDRYRCWGDNTHGQLGTGNASFLGDAADEVGDGLALVDLPADTTVTSMALGWDHTCVLYSTGDVACWGNNAYGQLGLGSTTTVGDGAGAVGIKRADGGEHKDEENEKQELRPGADDGGE